MNIVILCIENGARNFKLETMIRTFSFQQCFYGRFILVSVLIGLLVISSGCRDKPINAELVNIFGSKGSGNGEFRYVEDFAIESNGQILISDALNSNIQVFTVEGKYITQFGGQGTEAGSLMKPEGIAIDLQGNIHVADYRTGYIKKYSSNYRHLLTYSGYGSEAGKTQETEFMTFHQNGLLY